MDDFLIRAFLGGLGVALVAGPIGSFIVWRRMAYSGEALAHSSLLGVAIGVVTGINLNLAILAVCAGLAVILVLLQGQRLLASDTVLGILSSTALGLGMVVISFLGGARVDLMALLFGDILLISGRDLALIYGGGVLALAVLTVLWRHLLALTVHEDLARIEGVPTGLVRMVFMLLVAMVIAVSIKIVGVLLIIAMLIIPAATARRLAASPEQMAALAALIGGLAVGLGLWGSWNWDTPSGPSIVVAAAGLFLLITILPLPRRI